VSKYYKENNDEGTKDLFNKSVVYRWKVKRPKDNNIVDFNQGEKILYGRIRRDATPIIPVGNSVLKDIYNAPADTGAKAINFVVDVYEQMVLQFEKCLALGKIEEDPFLSNLIAYRAYKAPRVLYSDYKSVVFNSIAQHFETQQIRVKTFEEFLLNLKEINESLFDTTRFTFPGFVKSRDCSILTSGLAIEIADERIFSNDNSKIQEFVKSKNWNFYVNTCDTYGFMIDYNVPWRIVADIDSESMREAAKKYSYVNPYDVLNRAYYSVAPSYLEDNFLADLLELYNLVRVEYWLETEECGSFESYLSNTKTIGIPQKSKKYTFEQLSTQYDSQALLSIYLFMRLGEEKPSMSESDKHNLVKDVIRMQRRLSGGTTALGYFERVINKEFDKVGSYTYLNKASKAKTERAFAEGTLETTTVTEYK
jgi:hypothetical protein